MCNQQSNSAKYVGEVIHPVRLTPEQRKKAKQQLGEARIKTQQEMTDRDRLTLALVRLRFQMDDCFVAKDYNPNMTFGCFLKEYMSLYNITRKAFADSISISAAVLRQLINMHQFPPDNILIRLELHSNKMLPAVYWLKLIGKQKEHMIKTNKELRKIEQKNVHRIINRRK